MKFKKGTEPSVKKVRLRATIVYEKSVFVSTDKKITTSLIKKLIDKERECISLPDDGKLQVEILDVSKAKSIDPEVEAWGGPAFFDDANIYDRIWWDERDSKLEEILKDVEFPDHCPNCKRELDITIPMESSTDHAILGCWECRTELRRVEFKPPRKRKQ